MRQRTIIPTATLAAALFLSFGCWQAYAGTVAPEPAKNASAQTREVTDADNGKTVSIASGTKLVVKLEGNATTGYAWTVTSVTGKSVKQTGKVDYVEGATDRVGAGGTYVASFNAASAGDSTIKMGYARSFEKGKPAARTFTLKVTVTK